MASAQAAERQPMYARVKDVVDNFVLRLKSRTRGTAAETIPTPTTNPDPAHGANTTTVTPPATPPPVSEPALVLRRAESAGSSVSASTRRSKAMRLREKMGRVEVSERLERHGRGEDTGSKDPGKAKSVAAVPEVSLGSAQAVLDVEIVTQSDVRPSSSKVEFVRAPRAHEKGLSMAAETDELDERTGVGVNVAVKPETQSLDVTSTLSEPVTLAARIQGLIYALPFPALGSNRQDPNPRPAYDADGRPIMPPDASPLPPKERTLLAVLSSATAMNGRSRGRPSIFSVLERIRAPENGFPVVSPDDGQPPTAGASLPSGDAEDESTFGDTSSVMMYSPLIPSGELDLPELAEIVSVVVDGEEDEHQPQQGASPEGNDGWIPKPWSLVQGLWSTADNPSLPGALPPPEREVHAVVRKAWVPSATKISLQAMWWGYRLYLPPPIMAQLSSGTVEASKRAGLVTTALTWFFTHLPISPLPLPLQPVALLLQRIVPFLGYIGAFISWSWAAIKGYDKGHGVHLTATWLMPVALIPGTWEAGEFPVSPATLGNKNSPLPQVVTRGWEPVREFLPLPMSSLSTTTIAEGNSEPSVSIRFSAMPTEGTYSHRSLTTLELASTDTYPTAHIDAGTPPLLPSEITAHDPLTPESVSVMSLQAQIPLPTPVHTPMHVSTHITTSPTHIALSLTATSSSASTLSPTPDPGSQTTTYTPAYPIYAPQTRVQTPSHVSTHTMTTYHSPPAAVTVHTSSPAATSSTGRTAISYTSPAPGIVHTRSVPVSPQSATQVLSQRSSRAESPSLTQPALLALAAVAAPVPVGSHLEQHLLSGPRIEPIPLPEDDAAVSAAPCVSGAPVLIPTQLIAYVDKEERHRAREQDRARLRERARTGFRRG